MGQVTRVAQLLTEGRATLSADDGHREAELLLARALARDRAWLRAHDTDPVDVKTVARYREWLHRRSEGIPIAYLLGEREFWSLPLRVSPAVLIPRADSERLVELALDHIAVDRPTRVADLGTGSGAIALAIARERPQAQLVATDTSAAALAVANENACTFGLSDRVRLHQGSWLAALTGEAPFDVIVSNPPYIAAADPHLDQGDLRFEPLLALSSGPDGLDAIAEIVRSAAEHLVAGGWLLLEHGHDQAAAVRGLLGDAGFDAIRSDTDLGGNDRVSQGRKSTSPQR